MAAHMANQIRVLCKQVNVLTLLKRNCDTGFSKSYSPRALSSISGSVFDGNKTSNQFSAPALTSRGFQTDPDIRDDDKIQEEQPCPDHPLPNIEDPFKEPVEQCILCKHKVPVSYKNVQLLSQFISPNNGRLYGRYITKLCSYQQRRVTKAVKRARRMGFMPFMYRETVFLKDPNLFDIKYTGNVEIAMKEPSNLVEPETEEEPQDKTPDK
ncbi:28S ribosomal protein S18c, mitochondrial-like [Patiria miniata]|uniref:Mitochondrial ribosomal protein S18C n=1 Tax=Patiria miniata TaxID=46514 RepID=A0A913Z6E1_PATMI|nr:28S ribosomal protein S18c, mitochondrial-like [Patiria miniata]